MVIRRHVSYIAMNVLCQVYNMLSRISTDIYPSYEYDHWVVAISAVFFFGQGVFLNLIRWFEPGYLAIVWSNVSGFFEKKQDLNLQQSLKASRAASVWNEIESLAA